MSSSVRYLSSLVGLCNCHNDQDTRAVLKNSVSCFKNNVFPEYSLNWLLLLASSVLSGAPL